MLQRLYVNNFRCFENFEFAVEHQASSLLIGKNGVGKSTVAKTLSVMQSIGRGINRVGDLISTKDFAHGRSEIPIRFEITALLDNKKFFYTIALELPDKFKELRVFEERLEVDSEVIFSRSQATVVAKGSRPHSDAQFTIDWHVIALPLMQPRSSDDAMLVFRNWLARMIIVAPYPKLMSGTSTGETLYPMADGSNLTDWMFGLLGQFPASYSTIVAHLRQVMPDIKDLVNETVGSDAKRLLVNFSAGKEKLRLPFESLSDGEKCFFLSAIILAANESYGPILCFWDEPDNYLSMAEVRFFVTSLRSAFEHKGQLVVTSHNVEAIRAFSDDNTWLVDRKNHLEPTLIRRLDALSPGPDLITALISGDLAL